MYGTIAKLKVKPGKAKELHEIMYPDRTTAPGYIASYVYQLDENPNELWIAAMFEDKEAYIANAHRPETHAQFLEMREYLVDEPTWHDGEIVSAVTA